MSKTFACIAFMLTAWIAAAQCHLRPGEAVVLTGAELSDLAGTPVEEWFLFSKIGETWVETPFQIDERSPDGSYFQADDGLWDANDELVFLPQLGGQQTLIADWIAVADSRTFPRIEIRVEDPVEACAKTFYLYRSTSLNPGDWDDLMEADPVQDQISSDFYRVGFNTALNVWHELRFAEGPGYSVDLLDREKARIDLRILIFTFSLNEESATPLQTSYLDGRVRVIRNVASEITLAGQTFEMESERQFFPSFFGAFEGELVPDPTVTLERLRFSFDFSADAVGATISDPNNTDLLVDGVLEPSVVTTLTPTQTDAYWTELLWNGNAVIWAGSFAGLASTNELYFFEDDTGTGVTGDGTPDTGDMFSYGDTGLLFDDLLPGTHSLSATVFVDTQGNLTGPLVQTYLKNPLNPTIDGQNFAEGWGELLAAWHTLPPGATSMITVEHLTGFINDSTP